MKLERCEHSMACRTREAYRESCPELNGGDVGKCFVRQEYQLLAMPEEKYDAKLRQIQAMINREEAQRHMIPNGSGIEALTPGWRA